MHDLLQRLCAESSDLKTFLAESGQLTLLRSAEDNFRKSLILSAASLFEHRITESLLGYVERASNGDGCIVSLIRNKAVKRQYHTFFNWDDRKCGPFYTLLGGTIGPLVKGRFASAGSKACLDAFLEIGYQRNCLVHQNFADFVLNMSADEIRSQCELADSFVSELEAILAAHSEGRQVAVEKQEISRSVAEVKGPAEVPVRRPDSME